MFKFYNVLLLAAVCAAFLGCKKNVHCDNAELCVWNTGADTVWYSWGSNIYTDFIVPGGKGCKNVGEVHMEHNLFNNTESNVVVPFSSNRINLNIEVSDCYKEVEI